MDDLEERPAKVRRIDAHRASEAVPKGAAPEGVSGQPSEGPNSGPLSSVAEQTHDTQDRPAETTSHDIADSLSVPHHDQHPAAATASDAPLSKSAQKRQRKAAMWEAQRAERRTKRKAVRVRRREARAAAKAAGEDVPPEKPRKREALADAAARNTDVTVVLDCGFDELMNDREIVSLASQITRCYADNAAAAKRVRLVVAGFAPGTRLRTRFDTVLHANHRNWKGIRFCDEGLGDVLAMLRREREERKARSAQRDAVGGGVQVSVPLPDAASAPAREQPELPRDAPPPAHPPATQPDDVGACEEVYLTADTHHTLSALAPSGVYVVGALVDRNRHKNVCLRAAEALGPPIGTAKLPIGEYMRLASRQVLATNHVVEILLGWLDGRGWGAVFAEVMPARKGAQLIERDETNVREEMEGVGEQGEEDEEGRGSTSEDDHESTGAEAASTVLQAQQQPQELRNGQGTAQLT